MAQNAGSGQPAAQDTDEFERVDLDVLPVGTRTELPPAGPVRTIAIKRDAYVSAYADVVRRARQAPGFLDVAISADPRASARR